MRERGRPLPPDFPLTALFCNTLVTSLKENDLLNVTRFRPVCQQFLSPFSIFLTNRAGRNRFQKNYDCFRWCIRLRWGVPENRGGCPTVRVSSPFKRPNARQFAQPSTPRRSSPVMVRQKSSDTLSTPSAVPFSTPDSTSLSIAGLYHSRHAGQGLVTGHFVILLRFRLEAGHGLRIGAQPCRQLPGGNGHAAQHRLHGQGQRPGHKNAGIALIWPNQNGYDDPARAFSSEGCSVDSLALAVQDR